MKKILLVTPDFNPEEAKIRALSTRFTFLPQKVFMAPIGLATVHALTPDDIDVDIWDEAVHGLIGEDTAFKQDYDLVGVTGYINHLIFSSELIAGENVWTPLEEGEVIGVDWRMLLKRAHTKRRHLQIAG